MKADAYGSFTIKIADSLIFTAKIIGSMTSLTQVVKDVIHCREEGPYAEGKCIFDTIISLRNTSAYIEESFNVDVDSLLKKVGPFAEWIENIIYHHQKTVFPYR